MLKKLDELTTLSNWIEEISSSLKISSRCVRLELVLTEAVTNIIEAAYKDEQEHDIKVVLEYQESTVRIQLKDDGLLFEPLPRAEIVFPSSLEEANVGGLGIHLIRSYTEHCHYHRKGSENILTMMIRNLE